MIKEKGQDDEGLIRADYPHADMSKSKFALLSAVHVTADFVILILLFLVGQVLCKICL